MFFNALGVFIDRLKTECAIPGFTADTVFDSIGFVDEVLAVDLVEVVESAAGAVGRVAGIDDCEVGGGGGENGKFIGSSADDVAVVGAMVVGDAVG